MKRTAIILFFIGLFAVIGSNRAAAKNIVVKDFKEVPTDLTARMEPVYDNNGERCANLVFYVKDPTFIIEGNLGVLKRSTKIGEIRLWVPEGTRRLTIRHEGAFPLLYDIPISITSPMSYHAHIDMGTSHSINSHFYAGGGFNALSIQGPSVVVGVDLNHHVIEAGGIYGLRKTDNLYFYSGDELKAAYRYKAITGILKYGYDISLGAKMSIMPHTGIALNDITGETISRFGLDTKDFKKAWSASVLGGLRLSLLLGKRVKLNATPVYRLSIYKSNNFKLLRNNDKDIKKWADGIGADVGMTLSF